MRRTQHVLRKKLIARWKVLANCSQGLGTGNARQLEAMAGSSTMSNVRLSDSVTMPVVVVVGLVCIVVVDSVVEVGKGHGCFGTSPQRDGHFLLMDRPQWQRLHGLQVLSDEQNNGTRPPWMIH